MIVCHQEKKVNNSCSFFVLSFTTWDEVEIDLLKPGPCAMSVRKSRVLPSLLRGVSGSIKISKGHFLSQGKETLISVSFPSSHREHSSFFCLRGNCFGDELYGVTQEGMSAVQPPAGGTYVRVESHLLNGHSHWFSLSMRSRVHAGLWSTNVLPQD